jgi:uncharacterized RDD family membrane protein YckC
MNRYATFWSRFLALVIDFFVLSPILIFTYYIKHHVQNAGILACAITLNYSYAAVYNVFMHARYGQTLGKMVTRVRVMNLSEERTPSFREAIMRDIYNIVACGLMIGSALYMIALHTYSPHAFVKTRLFTILLYFGYGWILLDLIWLLRTQKRRALHDFIAGTIVVRTRMPSDVVSARLPELSVEASAPS